MKLDTLAVFKNTPNHAELRFTTGEAGLRARPLDQAALSTLVGKVAHDYQGALASHPPFGSTVLGDLGRQLYEFFDGPERWFERALTAPPGVDLRIATGEETEGERLGDLPWELLNRQGSYLAVSAAAPVLALRAPRQGAVLEPPVTPGNRPLRVLFMAASPQDSPVGLDFEDEEAAILKATRDLGVEVQLVVEESGSLEGLDFIATTYGAGYFDVMHLSGHAGVDPAGRPLFLLEDQVGGSDSVSPERIVAAFAGQWPRLVFLSGCLTARAPDGGRGVSMGEALVRDGAPLVLGWALSVADTSATLCAATVYRALAEGKPVDRAIMAARQKLFADQSPAWHMLRAYADDSPLTPLVTPLRTPGRERIVVPAAEEVFLDPATGVSRVASREQFVGRRRLIQRCLRVLTQPLGTAEAAPGLLLHGLGGLGKSTLACRLLERLPQHRRAVWMGRVDWVAFSDMVRKVFPDLGQQKEAAEILAAADAGWADRLRYLLLGPLARTDPVLFVFDDLIWRSFRPVTCWPARWRRSCRRCCRRSGRPTVPAG